MVRYCSADNCTNKESPETRQKGMSFHKFPLKDDVRERWLAAVRREDPVTRRPLVPGPKALLCSEHFLPSDFRLNRGYQLLKPDSVPSIFKFPRQMTMASSSADDRHIVSKKYVKELNGRLTKKAKGSCVRNLVFESVSEHGRRLAFLFQRTLPAMEQEIAGSGEVKEFENLYFALSHLESLFDLIETTKSLEPSAVNKFFKDVVQHIGMKRSNELFSNLSDTSIQPQNDTAISITKPNLLLPMTGPCQNNQAVLNYVADMAEQEIIRLRVGFKVHLLTSVLELKQNEGDLPGYSIGRKSNQRVCVGNSISSASSLSSPHSINGESNDKCPSIANTCDTRAPLNAKVCITGNLSVASSCDLRPSDRNTEAPDPGPVVLLPDDEDCQGVISSGLDPWLNEGVEQSHERVMHPQDSYHSEDDRMSSDGMTSDSKGDLNWELDDPLGILLLPDAKCDLWPSDLNTEPPDPGLVVFYPDDQGSRNGISSGLDPWLNEGDEQSHERVMHLQDSYHSEDDGMPSDGQTSESIGDLDWDFLPLPEAKCDLRPSNLNTEAPDQFEHSSL